MAIIDQLNLMRLRGLVEEKIEEIKKELTELKETLKTLSEKIDSDKTKPGATIRPKGRQKSAKAQKSEKVILGIMDNGQLETRTIVSRAKEIDPDLSDNDVRRILSKLGGRGKLENIERGMWKKKE